ncbi:hypothetical protein [Pararobbsia alpina]|uniref:hypothetical protein n=1 Tax=Pararobbsia alpina TaxID=621374 RepID=UPI0039A60015
MQVPDAVDGSLSDSVARGIDSGGVNTAEAAMADCQTRASHCQLYAVDTAVVWSGQTGAPAPTKFSKLEDATAVPYLSLLGRVGYLTFLRLQRSRAFAIAPDGAWGIHPATTR